MALDRGVGFIGAGNMAGALLRGLLRARVVAPDRCIVANRSNDERLRRLQRECGVRTTRDKASVLGESDVVVLAVKPVDVPGVLREIAPHATPRHLIVSVAAGVPLQTIEHQLDRVPVIRSMPNTSTAVGASATALCPGRWAGDEHVGIARRLFEAVGRVVVVPEALFDAVTGIAGSGPAYVYLLAEGMVEAARRAGVPQEVARTLVAQTILGAGTMLVETGEDPAVLRAHVTSPGGTTMAAVEALTERGFREAIHAAIDRAIRRAGELRVLPGGPRRG